MTTQDVINCCNSGDLSIEIFTGSYAPENSIDLSTARIEEIAFQDVLQIIPLIGTDENPKPGLGIVIKDGDVNIPDTITPGFISLKEALSCFPGDIHCKINDEFTMNSFIIGIHIIRDFPEIPLITLDVTDSPVAFMIPVPPEEA